MARAHPSIADRPPRGTWELRQIRSTTALGRERLRAAPVTLSLWDRADAAVAIVKAGSRTVEEVRAGLLGRDGVLVRHRNHVGRMQSVRLEAGPGGADQTLYELKSQLRQTYETRLRAVGLDVELPEVGATPPPTRVVRAWHWDESRALGDDELDRLLAVVLPLAVVGLKRLTAYAYASSASPLAAVHVLWGEGPSVCELVVSAREAWPSEADVAMVDEPGTYTTQAAKRVTLRATDERLLVAARDELPLADLAIQERPLPPVLSAQERLIRR